MVDSNPFREVLTKLIQEERREGIKRLVEMAREYNMPWTSESQIEELGKNEQDGYLTPPKLWDIYIQHLGIKVIRQDIPFRAIA